MGNNKKQKRKVQITSIITLFVFLVDIYLIIYVPADYILATAAFITVIFTIFTINSWFKLKDLENQLREEQYTDIMKAEKGTYVVMLDMLKEMDNKINFIGQKIMPLGKAGDENQRKIASMLDSIVQDQKKIAKITISRSKENADALMNSNDQLLVQMTAFRDAIEAIQEQVSKQTEIGNNKNEGFGEIKNELFKKMQELSTSIKKEVDEISENIEISNQSMESLVSASNKTVQKEEAQEPKLAETEISFNPETVQMGESQEQEAILAGDPVIPETIEIEGNDIISELLMEKKSLDEATILEESQVENPVEEQAVSDPNKTMIPEDIATLLESTAEENVQENVEAPVEEEKPPMPDISDPNKPMSPEDIAALIANTATEDLPEETAKFEEEEKPPMPDMSDPNKPMSPDDIAALIANM